MQKILFLSIALAIGAVIIPAVPLTAGNLPTIAEQLQATCSPHLVVDPQSYGGHRVEIVCRNLLTQALIKALSPGKAEFDKIKLFGKELSGINSSELHLYQFVDDVCGKIECHGLPLDTVRAVISSEINLRSDKEKNEYTMLSTVTGSLSTFIAIVSLCISFLTYRRGSGRPTISPANSADAVAVQKS